MLSPGKQPVTRTEKKSTTESACQVILYENDLINYYKQAIPIVLFYNSRDHYAPSVQVSAKLYNDFKIECFMSLSSKAVELAQEIDTSFLTLSQKNALTGVQRDIDHCKLVFKETSAAATAAATAQAHPAEGPVGPILREAVPSSSRVPHSDPPTPTKTKEKKSFVCDICGSIKYKKQDLDNHLRNVHQMDVGTTPYCDICKKKYGNAASFKLHVNSIHKNIWLHNCPQCDYKTNSKQQFQAHEKRKHSTKQEQELSKTFLCPNCEKGFYTRSLLQKHLNNDTCNITEKNFECDKCNPSKWFKANSGLLIHIQKYHTHEIELFQCSQCERLMGSKGAMKKHKQWHWDVEEKRKKRDKEIEEQKKKLEELEREKERKNLKRKRKGRPKVLKSSPAKIIMTGDWPSTSKSAQTPPHPSVPSGESTESLETEETEQTETDTTDQ